MTPDRLRDSVLASPSWRTLHGRALELVLRISEVLSTVSSGLALEPLAKALRKWFRADVLQDSLQPTLERYGLFRLGRDSAWRLADLARLELPFDSLPTCVVDVEATGGRPPLHRIIELGAVRIEADGRLSTFDSLVNPGRPLPPYITFMTGLKQAEVDRARSMSELFASLSAFLEGSVLVAHDVTGDMELLSYEYYRASSELLENPIVCTVAVTRALRPAIDRTGLEHVARELGIPFEQEHRALGDAEATVAIWDILKKDLQAMGVRTLLDLAFYQGQVASPNFLSNRLSVERLDGLPAEPGTFKLIGARGQSLHVEATQDVRKTVRDYFYPRHKLAPGLKKTLRETLDLSVQVFPTLPEAQAAIRQEKQQIQYLRHRKQRRPKK